MAITVQSTNTLLEIQNQVRPVDGYWLGLCFPQTKLFETEEIYFDDVDSGRPVAPFVSPSVQGQVMKDRGFQTKIFSPAYVKPKHLVNPSKILARSAGERFGGTLSLQQRANAAVASNIEIETKMIMRRFELMAASAIINGSVTVVGENYPSQHVDFGRKSAHTVALAGALRWDTSTSVDIIGDINSWMALVYDESGYAPDRITVSPNVWAVMAKNNGIKESLNTDFAGQQAALNLGVGTGKDGQYKGMLSEGLQVYVQKGLYEDANGTTQSAMPSGTIVLTSSGVNGVRCFGAILDSSFLQAAEMHSKSWLQEGDLSGVYTMTSSAPLMLPANPNATFTANVFA